jgi:ribosome biogenesis GTPase
VETDSGDLRLWGYGDHVAGAADASARVGRVVQVDRGECDVITADGMVRVGSDSVRAQAEVAPVTGDWVQLTREDGLALMSRVLPRQTALTRRDPAERDAEQVLAANFDTVGIVAGLDRPLPPGRFERMLVMARDSGAEIVILLTKADRTADAAAAASTVRAVAGDVAVLTLSVLSGVGISELRSRLGGGHTLALVGASGSGKSSLVNALAGAEVTATAAVRSSDRRGRHTTIARRLVLLPGDGGMVLDTPGVRALGLTDAQEALHRVFSDIEDYGSRCRFADCAHRAEPDCAVSAAVGSGDMDARRVERFLALRDEIEQQRIREEKRARSRGRR